MESETPPVTFTDGAVKKVKAIVAGEGNPNYKLRLFVQGGGCSGFQYGFTFDEVQNDDGIVFGHRRIVGVGVGPERRAHAGDISEVLDQHRQPGQKDHQDLGESRPDFAKNDFAIS